MSRWAVAGAGAVLLGGAAALVWVALRAQASMFNPSYLTTREGIPYIQAGAAIVPVVAPSRDVALSTYPDPQSPIAQALAAQGVIAAQVNRKILARY